MACVIYECRNCGHADSVGFGGIFGPNQCPECESRAVAIECDERDQSADYDTYEDIGEMDCFDAITA